MDTLTVTGDLDELINYLSANRGLDIKKIEKSPDDGSWIITYDPNNSY